MSRGRKSNFCKLCTLCTLFLFNYIPSYRTIILGSFRKTFLKIVPIIKKMEGTEGTKPYFVSFVPFVPCFFPYSPVFICFPERACTLCTLCTLLFAHTSTIFCFFQFFLAERPSPSVFPSRVAFSPSFFVFGGIGAWFRQEWKECYGRRERKAPPHHPRISNPDQSERRLFLDFHRRCASVSAQGQRSRAL